MKNKFTLSVISVLLSFITLFNSCGVVAYAASGNKSEETDEYIDLSEEWEPNPIAEKIYELTGYDMYEPIGPESFGLENGPFSTPFYLPPLLYKPVNYYAPNNERITRGTGGFRPDYNNNNKDLYHSSDPDFTTSGANNETIYNSVTTNNSHNTTATYYNLTDNSVTNTTNNSYQSTNTTTTFNSVMKYYDNRNYIYNPVENNYYEFNEQNLTYNNTYNTYYLTTNNYNYYITNNYTYNSYYIINNETGETDYVEVYYEMPDGRDSFNLKLEDVWGEYFVYDVKNYGFVPEDDGKTLALFHFDKNMKDSSFYQQYNSASGGSLLYDTGLYGSAYGLGFSPLTLSIPSLSYSSDIYGDTTTNEYGVTYSYTPYKTIEFVLINNGGTLRIDINCDDYRYSDIYVGRGINHIAIPLRIQKRHANSVNSESYSPFMSYYVNGIKFGGIERPLGGTVDYTHSVSINFSTNGFVTFGANSSVLIDEFRASSGLLYDSNFSVSSQPYDTNMVLVAPEGQENDIGVKGEYTVSGYRVGGVRPTYPSNGYVYVALDENSIVESVQQYQADGWYEVPAAIYQDGKWVDILGFNLSTAKFDEPVIDNSDSGSGSDSVTDPDSATGSGTVSDNGSSGDSDGGFFSGGFKAIIEAITKFFDMLLGLVGKVAGLLVDFFGSFLSMFDSLTAFGENFGKFLASVFVFIPDEVIAAIVLGINICIVLAIFKFFRN